MAEEKSGNSFLQTMLAISLGGFVGIAGNFILQERIISTERQKLAFSRRVETYSVFNTFSAKLLTGPIEKEEYEKFNFSLNELLLLASDEVRQAAGEVHREGMKIQREEQDASVDLLLQKRVVFRLAVKRELNMQE